MRTISYCELPGHSRIDFSNVYSLHIMYILYKLKHCLLTSPQTTAKMQGVPPDRIRQLDICADPEPWPETIHGEQLYYTQDLGFYSLSRMRQCLIWSPTMPIHFKESNQNIEDLTILKQNMKICLRLYGTPTKNLIAIRLFLKAFKYCKYEDLFINQ